ncbi:Laminin B (Domain IV) [Globodera pallida]|nr:Laminin B (Domain IV) [Globodera pallida]
MPSNNHRLFTLLLLSLAFICFCFGIWVETPTERFSRDTNHFQKSTDRDCYDRQRAAQQCVPDFGNAAYNKPVEVSRKEFTCGVRRPDRFRDHTRASAPLVCDARIPTQSHPPALLTDFNDETNETWWQSVTMEQGVQYPTTVNLTLRLGKAYEITYVRVKFANPRPESFVIYKKAKAGDAWSAWQYYSGSCRATFDLPEKAPILPVNEAMAQCTREFSDISPLRGGNIVFTTLDERPSAKNFEESEVLQDWVTATEIMLSLVRLNTHGDELFRYLDVLQSYYYAITDFAVGGRCKCNGHANQCVNSTGTGQAQLVCDCQHNTAGVDCQQCAPFFLDRPWRRATSSEANECLPCNCNGLSNRCFFDAKLFENTGHGGHCIDCAGNTQGPHCEQCAPDHWRRRHGEHYCHPCQCNAIGAVDGQCDERGQCRCKAGVGGQLCDRCEAGFYDFGGSPLGCKHCQCFPAGSAPKNATSCSPIDGTCACKTKVEGVRCDKCKPGHFHLSASNPFGCAPCFCFGHSSVCSVADGFYARNISSKFFGDPEGWTSGAAALPSQSGRRAAVLLSDDQSVVRYNFAEHAIVAEQKSNRSVYFVAPGKFIGDQRFVYGQYIDFALRVSEPYACTTNEDIMLIGANGRSLTLNLASQGNPRPTDYFQNYRFRIHADPRLQWSPASHEVDFISVLSNLSEIRIKGTFSRGDVGFMSQFSMGSATDVFELDNDGIPRGRTDWVERCVCPSAYSGQFCQFCRPGHKRADPFGGPLTKCVPCQCNEHAKECDAESGKCKCEHNTAGDTCAQCARGFYGNALVGKFGECRNCNCPDGGPCVLADEASGDEAVICIECPEGYGGRNGNVDPNAIGQCDAISGQCIRCDYHTAGWNCERCAPGFWGNALDETKGDHCKRCNCYAPGTRWLGGAPPDKGAAECEQQEGQCPCKPNVIGQRCDQCAAGFFNITSGKGCDPCDCDPLGTLDGGKVCDMQSGQCKCKKGVIGQKCDQCAPRHFGFGASKGCSECVCNQFGAEHSQCDIHNGQCLCFDFVEGRTCDRCQENRHRLEEGCLPCDDCYGLIQSKRDGLKEVMGEMARKMDEFGTVPLPSLQLMDSGIADSVNALKVQFERLQQRVEHKLDFDMAKHFDNLGDQLITAFSSVNKSRSIFVTMDIQLIKIEKHLKRWEQQQGEVRHEIDQAENSLRAKGAALGEVEQALLQQRVEAVDDELAKLASNAPELAERHRESALNIEKMASQIVEKSKESLKEIDQTAFEVSVDERVGQLQNDSLKTAQLLNDTLEMAKEIREEVDKVNDEAAMCLGLAKTSSNWMSKEKNASEQFYKTLLLSVDDLKMEMNKSENELAKVREAFAVKEAEARREMKVAEEALREGRERDKEAEKDNDWMKQQTERAEKAVRESEQIEETMREVLEKLEDKDPNSTAGKGNKQVGILQTEFETRLNKSGALDKQIAKIEKRLATGKLQKMTKNALEKAMKVKMRAVESNESVAELGEQSKHSQKQIELLKEHLAKLEQNIGEAEAKAKAAKQMVELETAQKNDEELQQTAKVIRKADGQLKRVGANEETLEALQNKLNSMDTTQLSDEELDSLESKLDQLEEAYRVSDVEQTIRQQQQKIYQQQLESSQLRANIDMLQEEERRLRVIMESMWPKCMNVVHIEQNGQ